MSSSERPRSPIEGPSLEQQDWDDLAGADKPVSRPDNGDLRYAAEERRASGRLRGENDDNPYQRSDEALPDDREEEAIAERDAPPEGDAAERDEP